MKINLRSTARRGNTWVMHLSLFLMLLCSVGVSGQTYYNMSGGDYSQTFTNLSTAYPTNFNGLAVLSTGSIPLATKTTTATNVTLTAVGAVTALGYDAVTANSTKMIFLSTGPTDNSAAVACDLNLNFTGRNAGSLSFNYANILNNSTASPNGRSSSLQVYYSTDGTTWTSLGGPYTVYNNIGASTANIPVSITLPSALNNQATVKLRFYEYNGGASVGAPTGSRPKISLDDIAVTSVPVGKTVTFNKNAAAATGTMANQTASIATNLTANAFVRTGYTFSQWTTNADGTGTAYANQASYPFTADATLYAQWTLNNTAPTVTTSTASNITTTSADSGGNVTADGGAAVSARGVYFGTSAAPTTGTSETGTTGSFVSTLSPLTLNTQYYYRAYATNSVGTSYGTESSFYTLANIPFAPTVGTPTSTSLDVSANANGNPAITQYAFHETTTNQFVQANGSLGATAVWQTAAAWGTKTVTGLNPATTYTFEVKARNGANVETAYSGTTSGITSANLLLDYWNLQSPSTQTHPEGSTFDVYAQAYKGGLTEAAGPASGLSVWIGYSSTNNTPGSAGWTWIPATFNVQSGNNDEFKATLGAGLTPGTYYYASRFQLGSGTYQYGGYQGDWNNNSGVLTVASNKVDFANIQSPISGTITQGSTYPVYSQVYEPGLTGNANSHANITGWIGYNTTDTNPNTAGWTWVAATRNTSYSDASNDEYFAEIGSGLPAGNYFYASRYQITGSTEFFYGGHAGGPNTGGEWGNPAANRSGTLTVQTAQEINIKQGATNISTGGSYAFGNQVSGTSSAAIIFTIENTGQADLLLTGTPKIAISGTNAAEFTVNETATVSPVTGNASTTFTVTFSPTTSGAKSAQLSIANNDATSGENPYFINLTGTAGTANDSCSGATSLTVNATATAGTLVASSPQSGFTENDVWYSFTPSCTGQLTITLNSFAGADLGFSVFATNCPASNTGSVVNQDTGGTGTAETNTFSYTAGTTYYLRVWKFGGTDTTFNIRVTSPTLGTPTNITANPTTFCAGATVTFTATAVTNVTSYIWTVPAGWTMTPSSTNVMTAVVGSTAGAVTAQAVNCYGAGIAKSTIFTPNTIPATPGTITGNTPVCQSSSNTYTIAAVTGATSYTWTLPSGWSGTSTTTSITTTAGTAGGIITVTANSTCGSSAAQTLAVTVSTPPATPATPTSDNASCGNVTLTRGTPPAGETWFWQGTNANGTSETDSNITYTVTASGTYYLRSKNTVSGCWSAASSSVIVTVNPITSITTQPSNQSAATGTTATFTVVAAGTGLAYQWQVNPGAGFVNVTAADGTGGTTSTFTTVATTLAMNGYQYRVIINGTCGSITSDGNATLTVADIIYVNGDFMTKTGGTWTNNATGTATWFKRVGGVWDDTTGEIPNGSPGSYTVYITKDIEVPAAGSSQLATAKIHILDNATFTHSFTSSQWTYRNIIVEPGATIYLKARFTVLATGDFEVKDGGNFIFDLGSNGQSFSTGTSNYLAGKENFHPNSNFIIKNTDAGDFLTPAGLSAIFPNSANAYFGNIIVDYSGGESNLIFITSGTYTNVQFQKPLCNDLIFRTSNGSPPRLYQATSSYIGSTSKLTILGSLITENTFAQSISFTTATTGSGSYYFKINKNFIHNAPVVYNQLNTTINVLNYMQVGGNVEIGNNAKYNLRIAGSSTATSQLEIAGNLTVSTTGELSDPGTNTLTFGNVYLNGSTLQLIDYKNQLSNYKLAYSVRNGSTVQLVNQDLALGTNSSFTVKTGGTLDFGFSGINPLNISRVLSPTITGSQTFLSETGSTLKITSPDGITNGASVYTGNVQVGATSAARVFDPVATYHYIGKANQSAGNGLPKAASDKKVIVELDQDNLEFKSDNGIIRFNNPISATGLNFRGLEIRKGTVISDNNGNRFEDSSTAGEKGNLKMTGGIFKLFAKDAQPSLTGVYELSAPSKIDFALTDGADTQSIRGGSDYIYPAIEVTGKSVTHTSANINMKSAGTFTVKDGGLLSSQGSVGQIISNDESLRATLIIENNGTFATQREKGFYGPANNILPAPSVRDNMLLSFVPNSIVEYSRLGDQSITSQILGVVPNQYNYQNLTISGSGIKTTAEGLITVKQMTKMTSATAELLVPSPTVEATPNVFYALGGIDNTTGTTGLFHLANDAQLMQSLPTDNSKASIQVDRNVTIPNSTFNQYVYFASPVIGQNYKSIYGGNISVLRYVESTDKFVFSSGFIGAGGALAVRNPSTGGGTTIAKFTGTPFVGDVGYPLAFTDNTHGYNLVGNPYPSNVNLDQLYLKSTNLDSTFYFWDNYANSISQQQGSSYNGYAYATYNAVSKAGVKATGSAANTNGDPTSVSGLKEPNYILKMGQGFLAKATNTGASIGFANEDRITDQVGAEFFGKSAADSTANRYWLEMLTPTNLLVSNAVVYFDNGTNEFSKDDSRMQSTASDALFTDAGQEKVVINGRSTFIDTDVLKVGNRFFVAGGYQIRLGKKEGIFAESQTIYLKDKVSGIITNLSQGNYSFTANAGEQTGRFEIIYRPESVLATGENTKDQLQVYRDGDQFTVRSNAGKIEQVEIYDVSGRLLQKVEGGRTELNVDATGLANGIYVLKIKTVNAVISKKIMK